MLLGGSNTGVSIAMSKVAAAKKVPFIAIGAGVSDGLGYGDNTKASLVTRALAEMRRLGSLVMRAADARRIASIMISNSIRNSLGCRQVDCTT